MIIPIRAAIIRAVQSGHEKSCLGLQGGAQLSHRLLWARFMTKSAPPVDLSKATPAPDKTSASTESSASKPVAELKVAQELESLPVPAAATVPEATETAVSATPEVPVPLETPPPPPAASETPKPKPAPVTAPIKPPQDVEYERILQTCKQQQPKVGNRIVLRFKNDRPPVEGVLEQTTAEGVKVKVPAGVVEYPFRLVAQESRLMFFPEERARFIQRQKSP